MSALDASVVLKWFVDEEDSDQALRLREEFYTGRGRSLSPTSCCSRWLMLYGITQALLLKRLRKR